MTDAILIAGAGPVGLTLAMALKRQGIDIRIVDKAPTPTDKSKALVVWPRTLELLDIQGCAPAFVDAGMKATGARILARGDTLVHVHLDTARSVYPYALMIPQSETERLLGAELAALGVQVERSVELISFVDDGASVTAVLRHAGREESVQVAYLAGCDGAHSTVRHALGARFEGETMPTDWVLADVAVDGDIPRDEITICWSPEGVLALFPMIGGRFRVVADVGLRASNAADVVVVPPTLQEVQALVDARGPSGLTVRDAVWLSHFAINERKVKDYRQGRVFMVGDAAHVHSPAGGQGMNTGMQDAFNLAWKLAMVWHEQASPALLDSYSPERSAIGDQVLQNAGTMTKVSLLRNPILQEIRGLAAGALSRIPALRQRLVDQLSEINLHYRDSPLTEAPQGASHHPAGGERAPDVGVACIETGATRLHAVLATGKFAVLSVGAPLVNLPDALRAIATAADAHAAPGYDAGHVYLVRPDAYVVMSTRGDDPAAIVTALQRLAVVTM